MMDIFIVEDSPRQTENLVALLRQRPNYSISTFEYAYECLKAVTSEIGIIPDVIITDIGLPDDSGLKLIEKIRHLKHLDDVCIIVSSTDDAIVGIEYLTQVYGGDGFIPKPIDASTFWDEFDSIVEEHYAEEVERAYKPSRQVSPSGSQKSDLSLVEKGEWVIELANLAKREERLTLTAAQRTFWANVRHSAKGLGEDAEAKDKWGAMVDIAIALRMEPWDQDKTLRYIALTHKDANVRASAIRCLGLNGDKEAIAIFISALDDKDKNIRLSAVEAMDNVDPSQAVDKLTQLVNDPAPSIQIAAIRALAKIGNLTALNALRASLEKGDKFIRHNVVRALGAVANPAVLELLLEHLGNESDLDVLNLLINQIAQHRNQSTIAVLQSYLDHSDQRIQKTTRRVIDELSNRS